MLSLPPALAPLGAYKQFILCQFVPSANKPGKMDKHPIDWRTGRPPPKESGGAFWPEIWLDAQTACNYAATWGTGYGVGFAFTEHDPFWFLDIDKCISNNTLSPLASQLLSYFNGAAVEVSQSGTGLHVFGVGRPPDHGSRNQALGLEFYSSKRFVALTGYHAHGSASTDFTAHLPHLVASFFPPPARFDPTNWTTGPCEGWRGPVDDDDLIRRAMMSQSAGSVFGNRASFADLWTGNIDALTLAYPDPGRSDNFPYSRSSADRALAQHLAFWTGKDCERMLRLMMKSGLVRDKWERESYVRLTIETAVASQQQVLQDQPMALPGLPTSAQLPAPVVPSPGDIVVPPSVPVVTPEAVVIKGSTFLGMQEQIELFKSCVYVIKVHKALIPGGELVNPERFRVLYGGYMFALDNKNERQTRDAWEAFTQSQILRCPRVDAACFKPDLPAGAIIEEPGRTRVNTWWPVPVARKVGDMTPFFTHMAKVLPNERDRLILLSYMAACVQHKGVKFQWAPLLQGVEGNGKTTFTRCVAEAVGWRYTHMPPANEITEKFNDWLFNNVFIGVEDVYVPEQKRELLEILKPMITGEHLSRREMGVSQYLADCCANFLFNSNHKNALRKSRKDRRLAIMFCAQQVEEDLIRDGMGGNYFPALYDWLRREGYAIVSEFLHTWPIPPEFNPAGVAIRAPRTSSTEEAISASYGSVEQEVLEAIGQGLPGFMGGWISSIQLDNLLGRLGRSSRISHTARRDMLHELGYEAHPGLPDGRVNNLVLPDNGKPRLFIRKDSPARALVGAAEVARAYTAAQSDLSNARA